MKAKEWRALSRSDLVAKLTTLGEELFRLQFRNSYRRLENTAKLRQLRKDIARIHTVMREMQHETA